MGAPKGNKFAEGNEGGRPPIHTDPLIVDKLIKDYFDYIEGEKEEKAIKFTNEETGEVETEYKTVWTRYPENPTVTGLALHLRFCDKSSLYDYAKKEEFSHSIKSALSRIEKFHELKVSDGDKCVGNIFVLKNFNWKDSRAIDHSGSITQTQIISNDPLANDTDDNGTSED